MPTSPEVLDIPVPPSADSSARRTRRNSVLQRLIPWLVVTLALLLRLAWLDLKPPHFDEGVNGWFVDQMTYLGYYHYDPCNYHGPLHFYILFLAQTLFGRHIWALRLPLVLVNVATIWFVLQFERFFPRRACILAALAFAVSPGMLFYSRYAIHEPWFVLGQVMVIWGLSEIWTHGGGRGLWASVMGVALLILTKETYVIHLVAIALAVGTLAFLERFIPSEDTLPRLPVRQQWNRFTLVNSLVVALLLIVFFYSGGFSDPNSLKGLIQTFAAWFRTGMQGAGHQKPFWYWLKLIGCYEWSAAIGLLCCLRALFPRMNRLARFIAIYGCGTLVAYSLVPYKTPWCIISIVWPFLLLFGVAMDEFATRLTGSPWSRWMAGTVVAIILFASLAKSVQLNYFRPTNPAEPYVYVQTLNDLFKLTEPLKCLAAKDPAAYKMPGNILLDSYHPLPWVLGDFTAVSFYDFNADCQPTAMDAGFILAEQKRINEVESKLKDRYFVESFHLRDGMAPCKLYMSYARFTSVFPGRLPEFDPGAQCPQGKASAQAPSPFSKPEVTSLPTP